MLTTEEKAPTSITPKARIHTCMAIREDRRSWRGKLRSYHTEEDKSDEMVLGLEVERLRRSFAAILVAIGEGRGGSPEFAEDRR